MHLTPTFLSLALLFCEFKQILHKSRSAFSEKWICAFSHKQPIQTKTPTHSPVLLGCSNHSVCAVESINRRYYVKHPPPFAENLGKKQWELERNRITLPFSCRTYPKFCRNTTKTWVSKRSFTATDNL